MKYKLLTGEYSQITGTKGLPVKVFKIYALKTFEVVIKGSERNGYVDRKIIVKEGEIGGFVQSEANLPQDDNSWVFNTAHVFENAVLHDSVVLEGAKVCDNATVTNSTVAGRARVFGSSIVRDSFVGDNVDVSGFSVVNSSYLHNAARVNGKSTVTNSKMFHGSRVNKESIIDNCVLKDQAEVTQNAQCTNCEYSGQMFIKGGVHLNETLTHEIKLDVISVADPNRKDF